MLDKFRSSLRTMKGSLAVLGAAASVVVAVYSVQEQIEANAREARITRSFTLYENFITSDAVNQLVSHSGRVELELKKVAQWTPVETIKTLNAEINARGVSGEFYDHMTQLLSQGSAIARCAGYGGVGGRKPEAVCDLGTVATLVREPIVDLFFLLRPVLYCDSYIEGFEREIDLIEEIVTAHFQEQGVQVYRTVQESWTAPDENYVVLEFGPEEHCTPFEGKEQTVALSARAG